MMILMRSLLLLLAAMAALDGTEIRWMISKSAIGHLNRVDPSGKLGLRFFMSPGNFIMNGDKGSSDFPKGWKATPTATFRSYGEIKAVLEGGKLPADVKAIIYDNESWQFTPKEEQLDLDRFERLAAEEIHRHGRLFIATPAGDLVPVLSPKFERGKRNDEYLRLGIARLAARYADVYEIQAQYSLDDPPSYIRFVKAAAAQAHEVNPKVQVFAGLSTNPSGKNVTGDQLYQAVEATRGDVDGYWLNIPAGGPSCPKCGEAQPQVAVELLKKLQ